MYAKNPIGEIVDVLGAPGNNEVEMHSILAEYDLPYHFPEEVNKVAERIIDKIPASEYKERRDFRQTPTFTIDPADAKDFDDALSFKKLPNGNVEVGVHIADVTHYVIPTSVIDNEAVERATSVYLVDRTVPMILSAAALSVIGGVSILTFTKTFGTIFLGTPRQELKSEPTEVSKLMLLPQYATVAAMMAVAIFPGYFIGLAGIVLRGQYFSTEELASSSISGYASVLSQISFWSLIFIAMVGVVYAIRLWFSRRGVEYTIEPTWGCGYTAPSSRIQYTGKSFSKSLGKLLNFIIIEKKSYSELTKEEVFPQQRKYATYYHDGTIFNRGIYHRRLAFCKPQQAYKQLAPHCLRDSAVGLHHICLLQL